jgi:hypothetical protein
MTKDQAERDFPDATRYHRREWRVQRIGWVCMAVFLGAAIAGLFGGGPVSEVTATAGAGTLLTYDRFSRYGAKTLLQIDASTQSNLGKTLTVRIAHSFIDDFRILAITPEPTHTRTTTDNVEFSFAVASLPATVIFRLEPERLGSTSGEVRIDSVGSAYIAQFVYP